MNLLNAAPFVTEALETTVTLGTRLYVIGSEIFTVSAMMWCLSTMANLVEKTYDAGLAFGKFYRQHLHSIVLAAIAITVVIAQVLYEFAVDCYKNRDEIASDMNDLRNTIGSYFVYTSPTMV